MKTVITKDAAKALKKAPKQVQTKFFFWVKLVETKGIQAARKLSSFNDEVLSGQRKGQRSIRLNQQWRAFYSVDDNKVTITVLEVTAHDYRKK